MDAISECNKVSIGTLEIPTPVSDMQNVMLSMNPAFRLAANCIHENPERQPYSLPPFRRTTSK